MYSKILKLAVPVAVMSLLTACSTTKTYSACPKPAEYSKVYRKAAAAELKALPAAPYVDGMLADYFVLRQQVKVCN
jgi:hypothetical protein